METVRQMRLYLITALLAVLSVPIKQILSHPQLEATTPIHVSWIDKESKYDFIFNVNYSINSDYISQHIAPNSLATCMNSSACLLHGDDLVHTYKLAQIRQDKKLQKFIFTSVERNQTKETNKTSSITTKDSKCTKSTIYVNHYCNTHWNPPIHMTGDGCNHTFEWLSPHSCPKETTNYQQPCYVYEPSGNLIDLTPLIKSNGSSYEIDTGEANNTLTKFDLNVCNEANEQCGPNVSACYIDQKGSVEAGLNNMTSLKYDAEEKTTKLTLLGQYHELCPDNRVKTVVNFKCKDKKNLRIRPKIIKFSECGSIIEWQTIHACPLPDIKVPATECSIKNKALDVNINLRQIINNSSTVLVPGINVDGKNQSMMLGICRGISSSLLKCEGKSTSTTSACLLDSGSEIFNKNTSNSHIIGSITKSFIRLTDNRVYLESTSVNKDCQVSMGRYFNVTRQLGSRIEFFCSTSNYTKPTFIAYEDCTYVFEWGSPLLCLGDNQKPSFKNATNVVAEHTTQKTDALVPPDHITDSDLGLDTLHLEIRKKTAHEMHNETLDDATKMLNLTPEKIESKSKVESQVLKPLEGSSAKSSSLSNAIEKNNSSNTLSKEPTVAPKMNYLHKVFMIGLILVSMSAFIVAIFILDKKTQLRIPLNDIRRQARQVFQPQQVPYSRVDRFNDSLDL